MGNRSALRIFSILIFCSLPELFFSQTIYGFDILKTPDECSKGSAALSISGISAGDAISISWSTGQMNTDKITDLEEGEYSVYITITTALDTTLTDTTLKFSIEKQLCPVSISNNFTPNGDGYNDVLGVSNADKYPNFQFDIFDKWGQRVYTQRSNYIPWDGKWVGVSVPDGTYYYLFFYDASDKNKFVKGSVTILR